MTGSGNRPHTPPPRHSYDPPPAAPGRRSAVRVAVELPDPPASLAGRYRPTDEHLAALGPAGQEDRILACPDCLDRIPVSPRLGPHDVVVCPSCDRISVLTRKRLRRPTPAELDAAPGVLAADDRPMPAWLTDDGT